MWKQPSPKNKGPRMMVPQLEIDNSSLVEQLKKNQKYKEIKKSLMKTPKSPCRLGPLRKSFSNLDLSLNILHQRDGTGKPEKAERKCVSVSKLEEPEVEKETPEKGTSLVKRLRNLWSQVRRNLKISYVKKPGFPDQVDQTVPTRSTGLPCKTVRQTSAISCDSRTSQYTSAYDDDDDTFKTVTLGNVDEELDGTRWCKGDDVCGADLQTEMESHTTYFSSTGSRFSSTSTYNIAMSPGYLKRIIGSPVEKYASNHFNY